MTIPCSKCGVKFAQTPRQVQGHYRICKLCISASNRERLAMRRAAGNTVKQKPKTGRREYMREYRNRPEVMRVRRARAAINNGLHSGRVKRKPCERCGDPKAVAHHTDYDRPLDVIWLCLNHHLDAHLELRRQASMQAREQRLA